MTATRSSAPSGRLVLAGSVALLAVLARAFLDWRYVYPEFTGTAIWPTVAALAFYVAVAAVWIWALLEAAAGRRRGVTAIAVLVALMLLGQAVATWFAFCAFPCGTAAPLMETANSGGAIIGAVTLAIAVRALRRPA